MAIVLTVSKLNESSCGPVSRRLTQNKQQSPWTADIVQRLLVTIKFTEAENAENFKR